MFYVVRYNWYYLNLGVVFVLFVDDFLVFFRCVVRLSVVWKYIEVKKGEKGLVCCVLFLIFVCNLLNVWKMLVIG